MLARASLAADASARQLAAADPGAMSHDTVNKALRRFAPVVETLRHVKRDEFTAAWQAVAIKSVAAMDQFLDGETPIPVGAKSSVSAEIRNLAVAAGIASEKALLFAGQPTAITAMTHGDRLELPGLIARVQRVLAARVGEIGPGGGAHDDLIATARVVSPDPRQGGE